MIFRLAHSALALETQRLQICAQHRQRQLHQRAGEIPGSKRHDLPAPQPNKEILILLGKLVFVVAAGRQLHQPQPSGKGARHSLQPLQPGELFTTGGGAPEACQQGVEIGAALFQFGHGQFASLFVMLFTHHWPLIP